MSRLLRANFVCLWKNIFFWLCIGYVVVATCFMSGIEMTPENVLPDGVIYVCMMFFICICNIIGMEYQDGAIRNKLVAGYSRKTIYIANFIVCAVASIIMYSLFVVLVAGFTAGRVWWNFEMPAKDIFAAMIYCIFPIISYTGIFVFISMLVGKRAESLVISVLLVVCFFVIAVLTEDALEQPEYITTSMESFIDENGVEHIESENTVKNPSYISGVKRDVYQFINDILPSCQLYDVSCKLEREEAVVNDRNNSDVMSGAVWQRRRLMVLILYSLLSIGMTTSVGMYFFGRKNVK